MTQTTPNESFFAPTAFITDLELAFLGMEMVKHLSEEDKRSVGIGRRHDLEMAHECDPRWMEFVRLGRVPSAMEKKVKMLVLFSKNPGMREWYEGRGVVNREVSPEEWLEWFRRRRGQAEEPPPSKTFGVESGRTPGEEAESRLVEAEDGGASFGCLNSPLVLLATIALPFVARC